MAGTEGMLDLGEQRAVRLGQQRLCVQVSPPQPPTRERERARRDQAHHHTLERRAGRQDGPQRDEVRAGAERVTPQRSLDGFQRRQLQRNAAVGEVHALGFGQEGDEGGGRQAGEARQEGLPRWRSERRVESKLHLRRRARLQPVAVQEVQPSADLRGAEEQPQHLAVPDRAQRRGQQRHARIEPRRSHEHPRRGERCTGGDVAPFHPAQGDSDTAARGKHLHLISQGKVPAPPGSRNRAAQVVLNAQNALPPQLAISGR